MTDIIKLDAYAKINLYLDVTGRREDNYHNIESVMQSISLSDTITICKKGTPAVTIACDNDNVPCNEDNICIKAYSAFFDNCVVSAFGVHIDIQKNIPVKAGLGGGSADASAVLVALNMLCKNIMCDKKLIEVGASVGADVPFCLCGGTAYCTGIGEIITPLNELTDCYIVVSQGKTGISTKSAYQKIDSIGIMHHNENVQGIFDTNDLKLIGKSCYNVFEQVTDVDDVAVIKEILFSNNAVTAHMSGSGSAVYGIFDNKKNAEECCCKLKEKSFSVFLCMPVNKGISVR